jgi:hypothetical protein
MPSFWGTLLRKHGSIAGDLARGSRVHLTNSHAFSYPGYSEMLVGRPHAEGIKSNAPIRNPSPHGPGVSQTIGRAVEGTGRGVYLMERAPRHRGAHGRLA